MGCGRQKLNSAILRPSRGGFLPIRIREAGHRESMSLQLGNLLKASVGGLWLRLRPTRIWCSCSKAGAWAASNISVFVQCVLADRNREVQTLPARTADQTRAKSIWLSRWVRRQQCSQTQRTVGTRPGLVRGKRLAASLVKRVTTGMRLPSFWVYCAWSFCRHSAAFSGFPQLSYSSTIRCPARATRRILLAGTLAAR